MKKGKNILEISDRKIENYAFSGNEALESVCLSEHVEEIGAHAFYNCRNLSWIEMSDRIVSIGDGAFKNCGKIHTVKLRCRGGNFRCLKDLLAELNQLLTVSIEYSAKDCAVLIFPYYFQDYEENTPARIINQVTIGSGVFYREAVGREEISYSLYDRNFYNEKIIDEPETVYQVALYRLAFPYRLSQNARLEYTAYLQEHFDDIFKLLIKKDRLEHVRLFLSLSFWRREAIQKAVEQARKAQQMDILSLLLEYEKEHYGTGRKIYQF